MRDVIVVGAGPSGLFAALTLARSGFDVAVLEEHERAGEPVHCTGVLAASAYTEFELSRHTILNELTTVRLFSPSGRTISYTPDRVEAVVIDRRTFDQSLCARALGSGVNIISGAKVVRLSQQRKSIVVHTPASSFTARSCILACGASYSLQRHLGLGFPSVFLKSAQVELPAKTPRDVEMHFGTTVAPRGFGWAVPVFRGENTFVRVGVMCDGSAENHFASVRQRIAERWGVSEQGRPRVKLLPLAPIQRTFQDRLLVLGDAAGLVKPTTGGGIYYSLKSALIAAEVLVDALRHDRLNSQMLSKYETQWKTSLGGEFEAQLVLRRLAESMTDEQIEDLFHLAQTDGIMPLIRAKARFNQHRDFIIALLRHSSARGILFRALLR